MAYRTTMDGYGFGGFSVTPMVKKLLIINVVVFLATVLLPPAVAGWFAFRPDRLLTQPWGAFTYMFVHAGFWHLFVNMLVLFFAGTPLEAKWGSREFLFYYLICGFGGVLLSFVFAPSVGIVGASAACMGLMLAFAMAWPDAPIYIYGIFPVQAKWLMAAYVTWTILSVFRPGDGIAHLAHLGGIVTGFAYLKADWRPREKLSALTKRSERKARRLAIVPRDEDAQPAAPVRPGPWQSIAEGELLDAVDRVLDKISAQGMSALTAEERGLLDEVSRRHRTVK